MPETADLEAVNAELRRQIVALEQEREHVRPWQESANALQQQVREQDEWIQSASRELTRIGPLAAEAERARGEMERAKAKAKDAETARREAERKAEQERFARLAAEEERDELAAEVTATTKKIEELAAGLASLGRRDRMVVQKDRAVVSDRFDLEIDVPLVTVRRLGMSGFDRDPDLRISHVPQNRVLSRRDQVVVTEDFEIEIRPVIEENVAECALVKEHRERAIALGSRPSEEVVESEVLVPRLHAHSGDAVACERVDYRPSYLVAHLPG